MKTRRYRFSNTFVKTNFTLGNGTDPDLSTYREDFNTDVPWVPHETSVPLPRVRDANTCTGDNAQTAINGANRKPTLITANSKALAERKEGLAILKDKQKVLRKTNFDFGNEPVNRVTAYQELSSLPRIEERARPFAPPKQAEILPPVRSENVPQRSTLRNDFTFFGRDINNSIYDVRANDLQSIKDLNARDSVQMSLLGMSRKMMTRSMVDYRHPLDRVRGNNIKRLMVDEISPSIRDDSVWETVNIGGNHSLTSETKINFSWPLNDKGMKRFYKGCSMNKVR